MDSRPGTSRRRHADLLRDAPDLDRRDDAAPSPVPSRVDQVRELLDLVDRGLLSEEEFERQQAKIVGS
ncbi:hypothetical protein GCM10027053_08130 [Intrasporangium mesophilum]